jgi:hypothetical protein
MKRKIVHYRPSEDDVIVKGYPATVYPIDHWNTEYVSNKKMVITSRVQTIWPNGEFETENSHYIPVKA